MTPGTTNWPPSADPTPHAKPVSVNLLDELQEKRAAWACNRDLHTQRMADEAIKIQIAGAMIADLDKAISALTPEGKEALLESQPEPIPTEVRKQDEQDAAGDWTNGAEDHLDAACAELLKSPPPPQEAPAIPEGGGQTEHDQPPLSQEAYEALPKFDDKTLIVDETPTIPRSEIPEGTAIETFTDTGVETVKLSGLTHIVSDEPERTAETPERDAYAPIHNEDEPAAVHPDAAFWAKALPAEAEAKAEEQKFNPFRLFGGAKKTLVGEGV